MAPRSNAMAADVDARPGRAADNVVQQCTGDHGNECIAVTLFAELSVEQLIVSTACRPECMSLFRTCAPDWNRSFRWRDVDARGDEHGPKALQSLIQSSLAESGQDADKPVAASAMSAMYRWTWLALTGVQLKVVGGDPDVQQPTELATCQLGIDEWRAAYFLDFGNQPHSRLRQMLERLMHWRFSLGPRIGCPD